jgi:hypothetical protein
MLGWFLQTESSLAHESTTEKVLCYLQTLVSGIFLFLNLPCRQAGAVLSDTLEAPHCRARQIH